MTERATPDAVRAIRVSLLAFDAHRDLEVTFLTPEQWNTLRVWRVVEGAAAPLRGQMVRGRPGAPGRQGMGMPGSGHTLGPAPGKTAREWKARRQVRGILGGEMLWRQSGAAIDMLGGALRDCPDELWESRLWPDEPGQWVVAGFSTFWYLGYHALFWLDLYLTGAEEGFAPPAPFALVEMEPDEVLPRTYTRQELSGYLEKCRRRCRETLGALTAEGAARVCRFAWGELTYGELQLYNLRHVQEHAAQLSMFLGQQAGQAARWAPQART